VPSQFIFSGMALEGKKDFSGELQLIIPESIEVAQSKGIDDAILLLLAFEKKCRINNDFHSLKETCLHIIRLCRQRNDWEKINSLLSILNKRRAQNKLTITAIVNEAMTYLDQTPTKADKIALIKTLMLICEGKIYVEAESARLHLILAFIYEEDGDINAACATIQDVHVETYGSIPREEKAEYIYHQTRFNILNKDFVRALIQSRKMNRFAPFPSPLRPSPPVEKQLKKQILKK
jgi:26S proteasome regulatory subunit N5